MLTAFPLLPVLLESTPFLGKLGIMEIKIFSWAWTATKNIVLVSNIFFRCKRIILQCKNKAKVSNLFAEYMYGKRKMFCMVMSHKSAATVLYKRVPFAMSIWCYDRRPLVSTLLPHKWSIVTQGMCSRKYGKLLQTMFMQAATIYIVNRFHAALLIPIIWKLS